jgi:hypothetical protein
VLADAIAGRAEPKSLAEQAQELAALRDLFAPPAAKSTPLGELVAMVKDFHGLKEALSDGDGDAGPLAAVVKQFAPAINKAVEALQQPPTGQPAARPAPSSSAPGVNGQPYAGGFPGVNIDALFTQLLKHAEAGDPPPDVAAAICDYLAERPEWLEEIVLGMVVDERERVVGRIIGSQPKLEPYRDWLEQVVRALLQAIESDDTDTTEGQPAATDAETERAAAGAGAA